MYIRIFGGERTLMTLQTTTGRIVDIDQVFKALSDPVRRSLLQALGQKEYFCTFNGQPVQGICVQDLTSLLELPQSTISRHLAILRQCGLVGHKQRGVWHYYSCNEDTLEAVTHWLDSLRQTQVEGATG